MNLRILSPTMIFLVHCLSMGAFGQSVSGPRNTAVAANSNSANISRRVEDLTNRKLAEDFKTAADLIRKESWTEAISALQSILDLEQDVLIEVERETARGKITQPVSAKMEANRLIGSMAAKGQQEYRRLYNEKAAMLLKKATETNDMSLIARIAIDYLHTDAGGKAMTMLATYQLDRGDYTMAALRFQALITRNGLDKLPSLTLFQATLAFRYARFSDDADVARKQLQINIGKDGLRLGDGTVLSAEQVEKELEIAIPPANAPD